MDTNDALLILFQKKLEFLNSVLDPFMLWWVSAVVFWGTALPAIWLNRNEVKKIPFLKWFFFVALCFLISIILFGGWSIYSVYCLERDTFIIAQQLKIPTNLLSEFKFVFWGLILGTSSFFVVTVAWIFLYRHIIKLEKKIIQKD